jgi:hypothetical protein
VPTVDSPNLVEPVLDRRLGSSGPLIPRKYLLSPGLRRALQMGDKVLRDDDESFAHCDPLEVQVGYRITLHSGDVQNYSVAIAHLLGLDLQLVRIIEMGSRLHDTGKIRTPDYRLRRGLTDKERARVARHPEYSGRFVRWLKSVADIEDSPILEDVYFPVRFHDCPELIPNPRLRMAGFVVQCSDILVSPQEKRHRFDPPMTPYDARDLIKEISLSTRYKDFRSEIGACHEAIAHLVAEGAGVTKMQIRNRDWAG